MLELSEDTGDDVEIGEKPAAAEDRPAVLKGVREKKVKGWLAWLCFGLTFGAPYAALSGIVSDYKYFRGIFPSYPRLWVAHCINSALRVGLAVFGIVAGARLKKLKKDGPQYAKAYIVTAFVFVIVYDILLLSAGLPARANRILLGGMLILLPVQAAITGAWYAYLVKSKRVKWTYGDPDPALDARFGAPPVEVELPPDEGNHQRKKVTCPQCRQYEEVPANRIYDPGQYKKFEARAKRSFGFLNLKLTCRSCGKQFKYEDSM